MDAKIIKIKGIKYSIYLAFDTSIGLVNFYLRKGSECSYGYKKLIQGLLDTGYHINVIISDGGTGIASIVRYFDIFGHQRCHIHLLRDLKTGLRIPSKRMKSNLRKYYIYKYSKLVLDSTSEKQKQFRLKHLYKTIQLMWPPQAANEINSIRVFIKSLKLAFTFLEYQNIWNIPKTTNRIEGYISHLNARLKTTRGLKNSANAELIIRGIIYYLRNG